MNSTDEIYGNNWFSYSDNSPKGTYEFKINQVGLYFVRPLKKTLFTYNDSHPFASLIMFFNNPIYTFFEGYPQLTPPNSFFILEKDDIQHYCTDPHTEFQSSWCHFYGSKTDTLLKSISLKPRTIYTLEKSETFTRYLDLIWKECTHYKAQDEKVISSLFQAWLYNLERGVTQKDEESQIPTFLLKARQFITNHYQKPLSLEEIAEHCDISPFYLSREFSATFGEPPISFLINYRLMQAEFLIKYSDSPMTEIASNCGYPNYFHFSKAFKKRHRLSPAQLRRESN